MKNLFIYTIALFLVSCSNTNEESNVKETSSESSFEIFSKEFVEELWKHNPAWATYEGYHKYDSILVIPDEANRASQLEFASSWLNKLAVVDSSSLSQNELIDYLLIRDYLNSVSFNINELRTYEWDPSNYNLGGSFFQIIDYKTFPLERRLGLVYQKMENIDAYYQAAKKNLTTPTKVHTQLAIQQLNGSISIFEGTLIDSLNKAGMDSSFMNAFKLRITTTVDEIKTFISYIEENYVGLADSAYRSFRIGEELFEKKFTYQIQSAYSAKEIFEIAIEEKEVLHENMFKLSEMLWDKYYPNEEKPGRRMEQIRMVIDKVSLQHTERYSFITEIRKQIPELEKFVMDNGLLTLDPTKPLEVRETPEYMRGFAGASISAPGPYDKNASTYYNVTPLDHYSEEEAESYLREYNDFVLQILNIHEAVPGHYTQLVYSNQSPSIIKSILGNGAMVEGWAVYTERMMLENGYGGDNLEMGLMYYKWNLRTVCNTILDYGIHVLDFTEEEAMQLLVKEAFQQKAEAEGKWKRARLSQVQLCSYFTGYFEILSLRDEMKEIMGDNFDLKEFHEKFLSYGSAPVKYIRKLMLNDLQKDQKGA